MAKEKQEALSSERLQEEFAVLVSFNENFLLKVVRDQYLNEPVLEIGRIFDPPEKINFVLQGGNAEEFDTDGLLRETYEQRSEEEKALYRDFRFLYSSKEARDAALEQLPNDENVKSATFDPIAETNAPVNDPMYPNLWGIQKINADKVWDCTDGCGVVVAIIDTGIDYTHNDLHQNMWEWSPGIHGLNFTTDNGNNLLDPMDGHSHGTHVAGTVAAIGNNNYGVVGVAPGARLMAIKGLFNSGSGSFSTLANCIVAATNLGAKVINNSWGPGSPVGVIPVMYNAITFALSNQVSVVFAAGNSNNDAALYYPQSDTRVLAVGAVDQLDAQASFTNYGAPVNVSAPGVNILSTVPGNSFNTYSGTSMAAPHVSGMIALIYSKLPNIGLNMVKQIVEIFVKKISTTKDLGEGRIDLAKLRDLLCNCQHSDCDIKKVLFNQQLMQERAEKFKKIVSNGFGNVCSLMEEGRCTSIELPGITPCFTLHWADSNADQIETHDTETVFITVSNPYNNIGFECFTITNIVIAPNQVTPNMEDAIDIVPSKMICYDDLAPCSSVTREYALITRNAAAGNYAIKFEYCYKGLTIKTTQSVKKEDQFQVTLIDS
ncbi:MAG: hypothetical protein DHS20C18_23020 [Saprospiraceae bacterium]|nr:MAG: hypothetical protein DHS20C18_23020 [Saprospiraceae bacterium]